MRIGRAGGWYRPEHSVANPDDRCINRLAEGYAALRLNRVLPPTLTGDADYDYGAGSDTRLAFSIFPLARRASQIVFYAMFRLPTPIGNSMNSEDKVVDTETSEAALE